MSDEPLSRNVVGEWVRRQRLANPVTKLILALVFDHAGPQEDGRWVAWASSKTLAWEACLADGANGARTVRRHFADLEEAGIIEREERRRGNGSQTTNRIVLLVRPDSGVQGGRAPESGGPRTPESAPPEAPEGSPSRSPTDEMKGARDDEFPEDLPTELHDVAIAAGKILKRTALTRGQKKEVTRAAVGHAVLTFPDRDHVKVARDVEGWLLHGKGARKSCADIVARYRNFLDSSEPMAGPPLPAGVTPLHGRTPPMTNADRVDERIRRLRGEFDTPGS